MPRTNRNKLTVTRPDTRSFNFDDLEIRAFEHEGLLWMDATHVCKILQYQTASHFLELLEKDEYRIEVLPTRGGPQKVTFVSEPGLYRGILMSRVPAAKRFKRWVTHTVLPEIRKTGRYSGSDTEKRPIRDVIQMMLEGREDGVYVGARINGVFQVNEWDKHTFLTTYQRTVFDMLYLFFTRAMVNFSEKGLLKYVPRDSVDRIYVQDMDWIIASTLLPAISDITDKAILPHKEMAKETDLLMTRHYFANPGEAPSLVRLKQAGFIKDDGKGGYIMDMERIKRIEIDLPMPVPRGNA